MADYSLATLNIILHIFVAPSSCLSSSAQVYVLPSTPARSVLILGSDKRVFDGGIPMGRSGLRVQDGELFDLPHCWLPPGAGGPWQEEGDHSHQVHCGQVTIFTSIGLQMDPQVLQMDRRVSRSRCENFHGYPVSSGTIVSNRGGI